MRPWWRERHVRVAITSDSSGNFWGGSVDVPGPPGSGTEPLRLLCGGSWPPRELLPLHINVKEAKAVNWVVDCAGPALSGALVSFLNDNGSTVAVLGQDHKGSSSLEMNAEAIDFYRLQQKHNFTVSTFDWIPSKQNVVADGISRPPPAYEYAITSRLWEMVEDRFGPFDLDLMSSEGLTHFSVASNELMPFISRFASPLSRGFDVFRQRLQGSHLRFYAHPPPVLVDALIGFLAQELSACVVVLQADPAASWWPTAMSFPCILLARAGDASAFFRLDRHAPDGCAPAPPPSSDLLAVALDFTPRRRPPPRRARAPRQQQR